MTDNDQSLAEAMARDLCRQAGHDDPDETRGYCKEPLWKGWELECLNFLRTYRAMVKAEKEQLE